MRLRRACAFLVCLGATAAYAQQFTHLYGHVLDPSEAGIPRASIGIVHEETGFRRACESGPDGSYSITSLQPGLYRIVVRREGFRTVIRFGIRLEAAQPTRLNVTLPVGSMQDTITVKGETSGMGGTDAAVGTVVVRGDIERLPLNGRGVLALLELAPGAVATPATRGEPGQFSVNGQRPNTNYFTVDGVSANSGVSGGGAPAQATGGSLPGLSAFGSMDAVISPEALQELQIQTSTTPADFGRLPGAAVSLSSRSGSSEFHGAAAYRVRHELLGANDWFANRAGDTRAPLRLHRMEGSLGGPVLRNRTFFFISLDAVRLRQPYAWRAPVPSLEARLTSAEWVQPVLALFPEPNGGDLGSGLSEWTGRNRQPASLNNGSARLDHALTARITLWGRYQDTPSRNEFGNTQVNRLDLRSRSATLGANFRPTAALAVDARVNASSARADSVWTQSAQPCALDAVVSQVLRNMGPCDDFVRFSISGVGQLVAGDEGKRQQTQYQAVASAALNLRSHAVRTGADYRRLTPRRNDASGTLSVLAETLEDLSDTRYLWSGAAAAQRGSIVVRELSLWAHDTWQLSRRVTVTGGARWEYSPAPQPRDPVYFLDLERSIVQLERRPLWPRTTGNIAPRLGVAWRVDRDGKTVVRAGGGWYYDSSVSIAADSVNSGPLSVAQHGSSRHAPFPSLLGFGFRPDLRLPAAAQWNLQMERVVDGRNTISLGYIGSSGQKLLRREMGGEGSTPTVFMALATNRGRSAYHALQVQYRRRFAERVQALASYTWSHSIDNSSSDSVLHWTGAGATPRGDRASSDFDLRHVLSAGFSALVWRGWSADGMLRARSGFPFSVLASEQYTGIPFANAFRANWAAGQPLWIDDAGEPGGRLLNRAAFREAGDGVQGNLGRNSLAGFGMWQLDLSLRREFRVGDRCRLQFRAEAFNALNRASFADPVRYLDSPLFGRSTSMLNLMLGTGSPGSGLAPIFQNGAPRSLQFGLRLGF